MKKKIALALIILFIFAVSIPFAACDSTKSTGNSNPSSCSIGGSSEVNVGDSITLSAVASGGSGYTVTSEPAFSTQNTDIIRINGKTVTGLKPGIATVTMTISYAAMTDQADCDCSSDKWDDVTFTPTKTITVVGDTPFVEDISLYPGEIKAAKAIIPAAFKTQTQTWSVANTSVATVDNSGNVTAVAVGETQLTLKIGNETAGAKITVTDFTPSISPLTATLNPNESQQFSVSGFPDGYAGNKTGTWQCSNTAVAAVDVTGKATAKSVGECSITFTHTATGKTATAAISVEKNSSGGGNNTAPTISGASTIMLSAGYAAHIEKYTVTGKPAPSVTVTSSIGAAITDGGSLTIPAGLAVGSYTLTISAKNSVNTATKNVSVEVTDKPTINGPDTITLTVEYAAHNTQYTIGNSPTSVTVDTSGTYIAGASITQTGMLTIPAGLGRGTHYTLIRAANDAGETTKTVKVVVTNDLRITGPNSLSAKVNESFMGNSLGATGGTLPYTFSIQAPAKLSWLACDSGFGALYGNGMPDRAGTFEITATVTDKDSNTSSKVITVNVATNLMIYTGYLNTAIVNSSYSETIGASGGYGTHTFTVTGTLPPGMSLSSGGVLSGMPTSDGTYNFTVTVTDEDGFTDSKTFNLVVTT